MINIREKYMTYPIQIVDDVLKNQAIENVALNSPKITSKNNLSILIIEDNFYVAESLSYVLQSFGYHVNIASTGSEGIKKALEIKPDVVLCDIGLPGMNGFEVAKIFKNNINLRSILLIGLSGHSQLKYIQKASEVGFDEYLIKPVDFVNINKRIASHFAKIQR